MGFVVLKSRNAVETVVSVVPVKLSEQSVIEPLSKLTKELIEAVFR
jgi:hypothetical protein